MSTDSASATPPSPPKGFLQRLVGRPLAWAVFVGLLFVVPLVVGLRQQAPPRLPVLGELPPFELTDQQGQPFGLDDLEGRAWVANFIFTRCPTICPALTQRMHEVQERTRGLGSSFHLVSFSVDPDHDTPAVLRAYAREHGANPRRWTFLTGELEAIEQALVDGFKVPVGHEGEVRDPMSIFHSNHAVLVDRHGRIRAYHDTSDEESFESLLRDIALVVNRGG